MTNAPADKKIDYVEFLCSDMKVVEEFYRSVFGWTFQHWGDEYMSFNDGRMNGGFRAGQPARGTTLVILYALELERTEAAVREAGGTITQPVFSFPGGRRFHFTDPAGNELAVWSDAGIEEAH